ncbi:MAG: hypothetical protein WCA28_25420, partial [Bradyrhizobium sp.]
MFSKLAGERISVRAEGDAWVSNQAGKLIAEISTDATAITVTNAMRPIQVVRPNNKSRVAGRKAASSARPGSSARPRNIATREASDRRGEFTIRANSRWVASGKEVTAGASTMVIRSAFRFGALIEP